MTRRDAILLVPCAIAAVLGAGLAAAAPTSQHRIPDPNTWTPSGPIAPRGPSPVIYPPQREPLVFSHARHAARGMACTDCHPGALTSVSSADLLTPPEATCARCHPIDRTQPTRTVAGQPPAACVACHPGYRPDAPVDRLSIPAPSLVFSHAAHATAPCATCHPSVATSDLATRAALPLMSTCFTCHDGTAAPRTCTTCHLADGGGLVQTALVDGVLAPRTDQLGDAHDAGWLRRHAVPARAPEATCRSCHAESDCTDCHAGTTKPFAFHAGDYALTHAIEARRGVPDCTVCHRQATFCVGCHERTGVGVRGESEFSSTAPDRRFHPGAFGGPAHAREAKRNLDACASCHRDDFCATCHTAEPGTPQISPHPPGWRGSTTCRAMDKRNRRLCLRCHVTQAELGCNWTAP
jgi:hypothetical protein